MGFRINFFVNGIRRLTEFAARRENLPYAILGGMMLVSLVVRLFLILA